MTFERWAKELLLNELKCNGEVKYDKKVDGIVILPAFY